MKRISLLFVVIIIFGCQRNKNIESNSELKSGPEIINLKYFGDIDTSDDPTTMWQKYATINKQKVRLELNYPKHSDKKSLFLKNKASLDNLEDVLQKARKELRSDFDKKGITCEYIGDQLKGFKTEDYKFHKIKHDRNFDKNEKKLFNSIKLLRVGIFLVNTEHHITLSYTIPKKETYISNELLVVTYNKNFNFVEITIED